MVTQVLVAVVAAVGVAAAQTGGVHRPGPEEMKCLGILARIGAERLLKTLELTEAQKGNVAQLAEERFRELEAIEQAKAVAEPAVLEAMRELRRVVLANNGVPDEVKAAVRRAEAPYKKLMDRLEAADEERAGVVLALLTAEQKAKLRPAQIKRWLLNPGERLPRYEMSPELRGVVADIRVMNLVNTLYLTPEQSRAITALIGRSETEWAALEQRFTEQARRALPALEQMAANGGAKPARVRREPALFTRQRAALLRESRGLNERYLAELKQILTPNQISMVANFVPCTVPVKSLTHPERVGQVNDNTGLERALDRIRGMPPRAVGRATENLERAVAAHFKKKRYDDGAIQKVLERVPEVVQSARRMDEAEYKLKRSELAEQLAVPARIAEGRELDRRIVTYLLSPNLAPLLQPQVARTQ